MGFGTTELLVVLAIVLLLFGTTRLKTLGSDLGAAIKGFRKAMQSNDTPETPKMEQQRAEQPETSDSSKIN